MLTKNQIDLVKATVPVLKEHGTALTSHFYKRMLTHNPELLQVFNQGHQRAGFQQQALANAVLAYAQNIENLEALLPVVKHIANKHVSLNIHAEHYNIVGKHLLASIKEVLGDAATPELIDAWAQAYGQLAKVFIDAENSLYDQNVKSNGWSGWRFFKVTKKEQETGNVTSFTLTPVDGGKMPEIIPGQYVSVRVYVKGENLVQPRQYTVTGSTDDSLRITVKKIAATENAPAGMVSGTLHNDIEVGSLVEVSSPAGLFALPEGDGPLCFISAGIGVTPLFAMVKKAVAVNPQRKLTFVHVCHTEEDFPLKDELMESAKVGNVKVETVVTTKTGRPDEAFFKSLVNADTTYLVCGPVSFMKMVGASLQSAGIDSSKILMEKFGTGAI